MMMRNINKSLTWFGDGWVISCFSSSSRWAKDRPHCSQAKGKGGPAVGVTTAPLLPAYPPARRLNDSEKGDARLRIPPAPPNGSPSLLLFSPSSIPDSDETWLTTESENITKWSFITKNPMDSTMLQYYGSHKIKIIIAEYAKFGLTQISPQISLDSFSFRSWQVQLPDHYLLDRSYR